jgi:hypothetical protein
MPTKVVMGRSQSDDEDSKMEDKNKGGVERNEEGGASGDGDDVVDGVVAGKSEFLLFGFRHVSRSHTFLF